MAFNPAIPQNSDSPSTFPGQAQTNWGRLNTLIAADHQFNNAAAANDGYHNLVHLAPQAPAGALASTGRLYSKLSAGRIHAFYMDDTGASYQMSPTMPIRAAVNFSGNTINSGYNVASVAKGALDSGIYKITFTTPMPSVNYIVQVTGMRGTAGKTIIGCVYGGTYGTPNNVNDVTVQFFKDDGTTYDVQMGCVTILSIT